MTGSPLEQAYFLSAVASELGKNFQVFHRTKKDEHTSQFDLGFIIRLILLNDFLTGEFFHNQQNTLVDCYFHTFNADGSIQYQGRVDRICDGHLVLCQLYSFIDGNPTNKVVYSFDDITAFRFYETHEQWRDEYDHNQARFIPT